LSIINGICGAKSIEFISKDEVYQGEPIAILLDGLVIITFDDNKQLEINIGDKLIAGQTVLA
jgi:hypothetical protein